MANKFSKEGLYTRREFFKRGARGALPFLACLTVPPLLGACDKEDDLLEGQGTDCSGNCTGGCENSCVTSCTQSCHGSCVGGCDSTCSGTCAMTCSGSCSNTCSNTCFGSCNTTCLGGSK